MLTLSCTDCEITKKEVSDSDNDDSDGDDRGYAGAYGGNQFDYYDDYHDHDYYDDSDNERARQEQY